MLSAGALVHHHGAQHLLEESVVWGLLYCVSHQDKCFIVLQEKGGLLALLQFSHCQLCLQLERFPVCSRFASIPCKFCTTVIFCHFESGSVCHTAYLIHTFLKLVFIKGASMVPKLYMHCVIYNTGEGWRS